MLYRGSDRFLLGTAMDFDNASQPFNPAENQYSTTVPALGIVGIGGVPEGTFTPLEGPIYNSGPNDPVYGYYNSGGFAGYTNTSFNVSGVGGTFANFFVGGPGTLSLSGLTATDSASFVSTGGEDVIQWVPGVETSGEFEATGYANSVETVSGGSLSTPSLTLTAGTNLYAELPGTSIDPVADAGSLIINGATLSGTHASRGRSDGHDARV